MRAASSIRIELAANRLDQRMINSRWAAAIQQPSHVRPRRAAIIKIAPALATRGKLRLQLLVANAARPVGIITFAASQVLHVLRVIALEPHDFTVALEGEDVGRDTIEEPAVVRDDHCAAWERQQRLLQR